jgi:hypothetical protein
MRTILRAGWVAIVLGAASGAFAQTPIPLTISGTQAQGTISLPGDVAADLTISFENAVGLTPTSLEASVRLVDALDPELLLRLPALTSIPAAFPVLLRIGPSVPSPLSFAGAATVSLHTHNLLLDAHLPLALHKAHDGGPFMDITTTEGIGSYRVSGSSGDFSEFLIVLDLRPIDTVIAGKFDALNATLTDNSAAMPPVVAATLQDQLSQARTLYALGATLAAVGEINTFLNYVISHSGADIPDVWQANNENLVNVAGLLRTGASTLKFSLDRKASR